MAYLIINILRCVSLPRLLLMEISPNSYVTEKLICFDVIIWKNKCKNVELFITGELKEPKIMFVCT